MRITILVPVYNDWAAAGLLITALERELLAANRFASVLVVDDGSSMALGTAFDNIPGEAIVSLDILHLRCNVGHQRAIAIGLAYLGAQASRDAVVVMDGDGEDRPEDVDRLVSALEEYGSDRVVFAERTRRSEGLVFAALYWMFRMVHLALTGERVRVGNFCVIPRSLLQRLVAVSDLWNHFAAAVFHARIPYATIPTVRGTRYAGRSQMNFVGLVTHGLSAMSVFGDRIGVRLLLVTCALTLAVIAAAAGIALWHLGAGVPLPAWFPYAGLGLLMFVFLAFATSLAFVFVILSGRGNPGFLPLREHVHYVSHKASIPMIREHVEQSLRRR
jgi:polyisoprenyl-phosphate glycosyltransferase